MSEDTEHIARQIRDASATVRAPERLRASVVAEQERLAPAYRRRLWLAGGGLAGSVAAVVVALVLVLGAGGGPTMQDAVALTLRAPTTGAPAVDPADPRLLRAGVGGVRFPNYPHWQPVGSRTDELDGRRAVTVAYRSSRRFVSYTIVGGDPLHVPRSAWSGEYSGFDVAVLRDDAQRVVTWQQGGRTCIVAGAAGDVEALLHDARA